MNRDGFGLGELDPDGITLEEHRRLTPDHPAPITPRPPAAPNARSLAALRRPQRPRPTCTVDGCDRTHEARGLCTLHYQRWKRARAELTVDEGQADELEHLADDHHGSPPITPRSP